LILQIIDLCAEIFDLEFHILARFGHRLCAIDAGFEGRVFPVFVVQIVVVVVMV